MALQHICVCSRDKYRAEIEHKISIEYFLEILVSLKAHDLDRMNRKTL